LELSIEVRDDVLSDVDEGLITFADSRGETLNESISFVLETVDNFSRTAGFFVLKRFAVVDALDDSGFIEGSRDVKGVEKRVGTADC